MNLYYTLFLLLIIQYCDAWDSEQLEVFDVVDEVKENFYEMLKIENNASSSEIRSAFRRLSVVWHPDKNPNEDTSVKFRNLVSVYEVLKDQKKRAYYDDVLVNGLPNWKSAMFYYRRVRKMGFLEGFLIIFSIITFGQYLIAWASYCEQKYFMQQQNQYIKIKKKKKLQAQAQAQQTQDAEVNELPLPSIFNTLPFQIPRGIYIFIITMPRVCREIRQQMAEAKLRKEQEEKALQEEIERLEKEKLEPKPKKRRQVFEIPDGPNFEVVKTASNDTKRQVTAPPPVSGGLWTDDDLEQLINLVKKYPGGTPGRWDLIAEALYRPVSEVTYMAEKMKNNGYRIMGQEDDIIEEKVKQKTKGGKHGNVEESMWTQQQQKSLEDALSKYPKGSSERWDRIADLVPNKTKDDCMQRYKYLVEMVKKQKEQ